MTHRPLSRWVTAVELTEGGVAQWSNSADVNYGNRESSARKNPRFSHDWQRRAIPTNLGYLALGLVREGSRMAVLEVDDHALPIRVSEAAVRVISRLEDSWSDISFPIPDLAVFDGEGEAVRYLLADRLAADVRPPAELFHILPWKLVDQLAEQIARTLDGIAPPPAVIELRHWFNPADADFTAALEQLDEGLRDREQNAVLARVAATALCSLLLEVTPERLPEPTRIALVRLTGRLAQENPFLLFAARRTVVWLGADGGSEEPASPSSQLAAAADTETEVRTESSTVAREPFLLRRDTIATGRAEITISVASSPDLQAQVNRLYGVMLLPVKVDRAGGSTRYMLPLQSSAENLSGRLNLPLNGQFINADIDGPPIGVTEAASIDPDEVRRSIRGLRTRPGRRQWSRIAELLPPTNALRALIGREMEIEETE